MSLRPDQKPVDLMAWDNEEAFVGKFEFVSARPASLIFNTQSRVSEKKPRMKKGESKLSTS